MRLPKIAYSIKKNLRSIKSFGGINKTENFKEGEFKNALGLSSKGYPALTTSAPLRRIFQGENILDFYEHNGKLLIIDTDGNLTFDGKAVGIVSATKKQFATVNTKLCIFPDKVYIDLDTMELHPLVEGIFPPRTFGAVQITSDSISFSSEAPYLQSLTETFGDDYKYAQGKQTYAYGNNRSDVEKCWDKDRKIWKNLREIQYAAALTDWNMDEAGYIEYHLSTGNIFIPSISQSGQINIVEGDWNGINTNLYNNEGIYCVITNINTEYEYEIDESTIRYVTKTYTYDAYRASDGVKLFADAFVEGDTVDVSGTPLTLYDGTGIKIEKIDGESNTLYFPKDSFSGAISYLEASTDISGDLIFRVQYYDYEGGIPDESTQFINQQFYKAKIYDTVKAGSLLYYYNGFISVWDKEELKVVAQFEAEQFEAEWMQGNQASWNYDMLPYSIEGATIKVSKHIPDLDYICESENRLWGVSNKTHTIYASALGLPGEFNEFDVISTDSYAVAVASEDDFTAICAYGGGVCCFKENRLHKILGSYPAEYYMNEYEIAGVQKGSERSLCIINEVLYYKGEYGVYAYSGGTPRLVSYELGTETCKGEASATDGVNYYISLTDGIYVYDKLHGVWHRPWENCSTQMMSIGDRIILLCEGVLFDNLGQEENTLWRAEFTPFDEDSPLKKVYCSMQLLMKTSKGSSIRVLVSSDGKIPKPVYSKSFIRDMTVEVSLPHQRCSVMKVIIEGKGKATLYGITREFTA